MPRFRYTRTSTSIAVLSLLFVLSPIGERTALAAPPTFAKTFTPATIGPGAVSTLTFTITNGTEPVPATDLAFTDVLPAGVTIAAPANTANGCGGTVTAPDGGASIALSGGAVGAGATCTIRVDVTSATPGTHPNTSGDLTSSVGNSGSAGADLTVATDRPGFSKSFSPPAVSLGERSRLAFVIDNSAGASAVHSAAFVDVLPRGLVVAAPADVVSTCDVGDVSAVPGSSVITLSTLGTLTPNVAAGATCTVALDVVATAAGRLVNSSGELTSAPTPIGLQVSSGKANAALDATAATLHLTKEFTDDPIAPGGTGTLRFSITNFHRTATATDIGFGDDLDAALTGLTVVGPLPTDPCGAGSTLTGTDVLTLADGSLAPEASCLFAVTVAVPAGAATGRHPNTTGSVVGALDGDETTGNTATDDLFVAAAPVLAKEFVDDPVGAGGSVTLRFTITDTTEAGGSSDIAFGDDLTAFLAFPVAATLPADGFCGPDSSLSLISLGTERQGLSMTGGSLDAGGVCSFDVTLDIPAGFPAGSYLNATDPVTATVDGATLTGNSATDELLIVGPPRLRKEFLDDPILPGGQVTLQFRIANGGFESDADAVGPATDIAFTDDLTFVPGLTALGLPLGDVCGDGSSLSGSAGGTLLTFTGGALDPFEVCTFSVTLQSSAATPQGIHLNTTSGISAIVSGAAVSGNGARDSLAVATVRLAKAFTDDPVLPGGQVTLEFSIDNTAGTEAATGLAFGDDLSNTLAGLAVAPGQLPASACGGNLSSSAGGTVLNFTGGSLAAGASCTFSVVLDVPAGADARMYRNVTSGFRVEVDGETVFLPNALDRLAVAEAPVIGITKEFTDDPAIPGGTVSLKFTASNPSPIASISSISFTDDLEATLPGLTPTGLPIAACGGTVLYADLLTFEGWALDPLESCSVTVTLSVPPDAAPGSYLNTTSEVTGEAGGPVSGPPASDTLVIAAPPDRTADLRIAKVDSADPVVVGDSFTYTITVFNDGPDDAADVAVTDALPAGVTLVATTGCAEDPAGVPTCTLGVVPAGGSASYTVEVTADGSFTGTILNTAEVGSSTEDPDPTNNAAQETTEILGRDADLRVEKTDDSDPVAAGTTLTYTVTVFNDGPGEAVNVVATDTLPAEVTLAATSGCAEDPGGVPTCSLGTIPPGGSASYTVTVDVDAATRGTITNTVAVTSDTEDPDAGNNAATEDTEVRADADLSITKTAVHDPVQAGSTLVYHVDVTNLGPMAAGDVVVTDTLPAGVTFKNTTGCAEDNNGVPTCSLGTIAAGATVRYKVRVKVDRGTAGLIVNAVTVDSAALDPDLSNNTATEVNDVRPLPPEATAVVDRATGRWLMTRADGTVHAFFYGDPGDYPFVGDWDCDGIDTPGLYRQSDGYVYLRNSNTQGVADIRYFFGDPGDVPLAGDFDGDGCDSVSLYRPSEGRIYVIDRIGSADRGLGKASRAFRFGDLGDVPLVADFDGDGVDGVAVYRTTAGTVYARDSLTPGRADREFAVGRAEHILAGDWQAGGIDSVAAPTVPARSMMPVAGRFWPLD